MENLNNSDFIVIKIFNEFVSNFEDFEPFFENFLKIKINNQNEEILLQNMTQSFKNLSKLCEFIKKNIKSNNFNIFKVNNQKKFENLEITNQNFYFEQTLSIINIDDKNNDNYKYNLKTKSKINNEYESNYFKISDDIFEIKIDDILFNKLKILTKKIKYYHSDKKNKYYLKTIRNNLNNKKYNILSDYFKDIDLFIYKNYKEKLYNFSKLIDKYIKNKNELNDIGDYYIKNEDEDFININNNQNDDSILYKNIYDFDEQQKKSFIETFIKLAYKSDLIELIKLFPKEIIKIEDNQKTINFNKLKDINKLNELIYFCFDKLKKYPKNEIDISINDEEDIVSLN